LAGLGRIIDQLKELVFTPFYYPELYSYLGVKAPCGFLLHGPSGCGKTSLALSLAGELGIPFFKASGPELIGGASGESEERIRMIFEEAVAHAPSILFIDALDVIAGKREVSFV
jgi:ribosome biogenesis ATPase